MNFPAAELPLTIDRFFQQTHVILGIETRENKDLSDQLLEIRRKRGFWAGPDLVEHDQLRATQGMPGGSIGAELMRPTI